MELYRGTIGEPGFPVISFFFSPPLLPHFYCFLPLPPHFYCFSTKQVIFEDQTGQTQGKRPDTGQKGQIQTKRPNSGQKAKLK